MSYLKLAMHIYHKIVSQLQGVSQLQCRELRYTAALSSTSTKQHRGAHTPSLVFRNLPAPVAAKGVKQRYYSIQVVERATEIMRSRGMSCS